MRLLPLLLLALSGLVAPALAADVETHQFSARVEVSAAGEITSFAVDPRYRQVEGALTDVVRRWRFEPARFDGQPVSVETTLFLELQTRPDGQGGLQAEVSLTGNGGGADSLQQPRYPSNALRQRASGAVMLRVAYDGEGKATGADVLQSVASRLAFRAEFDQAALSAAKHWTFRPERANGIGLPGYVVVPVRFQFENGGVPKFKPMAETAGLAGDPEHLLSRSDVPLKRLAAEG